MPRIKHIGLKIQLNLTYPVGEFFDVADEVRHLLPVCRPSHRRDVLHHVEKWTKSLRWRCNQMSPQTAQNSPETCRKGQQSQGWKKVTGSKGWEKVTESQGWEKVTESKGWEKVTESHGWEKVTESQGWEKVTESQGWEKVTEIQGWEKVTESQGWEKIAERQGWEK